MLLPVRLVFSFAAISLSTLAAAAPITFSAGGDGSAASIQSTVDSFRLALGTPSNGDAPGPLAGGRREINWDGGGSTNTTAAITPFNTFLDTRGVQLSTPGTGLSQATPDGLEGLFSNPTYGETFGPFSSARLLVPVGSNITDVLFFLPGSNGAVAATVSGFGAVFTDVDLANSTTIALFDAYGNSLYSASVEAGTVADGSLSFLGVVFNGGERIARARITTGNSALGPNDGVGVDVVAMDDFIYGEPLAAVPAPGTLALLGLGLAGFAAAWRRER
ncbi:PEP-CTERM sorting domain-containing protein [Quisquiliibacterium transsilvanicum]|uniref:Ice-binding protein C-terminal domain-containing protein n=1 Tax=Quisquiliibacterium transsilvanicum TaxID=1549638 RepID=A0A7W8M7X2_9BURK|nr:PEP-CTERM sorting domain-containing protein [Quisquiliibacterium transsilvanicum]MBB5270640.1 hypothetical protein [Quisquiliibacterium transsilvanicum]